MRTIWASLECTNFVSSHGLALGMLIMYTWNTFYYVRSTEHPMIENVQEFMSLGP
jgi:hypothetical protein